MKTDIDILRMNEKSDCFSDSILKTKCLKVSYLS